MLITKYFPVICKFFFTFSTYAEILENEEIKIGYHMFDRHMAQL